jgi:tetratricopeptide (TPR) repeat protein
LHRRVLTILVALLCAVAAPLESENLILSASPLYSLPLTAEAGVFSPLSLGGQVSAVLPRAVFGRSWLRPELGIGYVYSGLAASASSLSAVEAQAGLAMRFPLAERIQLTGSLLARGGYYLLGGEGPSESGFSPGVSLGVGTDFLLGERFSLGLGLQAAYDFGMYLFLRPMLSASFRLGAGAAPGPQAPRQEAPVRPAPLTGQAAGEEVLEFVSDGVFPVFYKFYADHPFGTVTVSNKGRNAWTDVTASFSVKQFMDHPASMPTVSSLPPGQAVKLDLVALFNENILSITEATKISGELLVEYRQGGRPARLTQTVALRVFDRNAMTWADDRRAAAFITAKDPAILSLAKSLAGDLAAAKNPALSEKLQIAAGIHEALSLQGINYVRDPTGLFSGAKGKADVDFLQFPRQTLEYRSGDCDDLSILYAALFEAVGVETAFITVPGHILMAVSLDMSPAEAKVRFGRYDELILREDKTWLPIETTSRKGGFLAAWAEGARQWRENATRGQAELLPVHAAWAQYEPVALPGTSTLPPFSNAQAVEAMKREILAFVSAEIGERAAKLQADARRTQGAARAINSLGVLYAQYGLYDKARAQFESVLGKEEYVPALINMGHLHRAQGRVDAALSFYDRAYKKSPTNTSVLLAEAMLNHQLENYGVVRKFYEALKSADPALADRHAYLNLRGEEGARAAEASGTKSLIEWMEGQ